MHNQHKSWIDTKRTANILLIIIAVLLLILLLALMKAYRESVHAVNEAERVVSNAIRPFRQLAQEIANNARGAVQNVETAVANVVNNPQLQNEVQSILNNLVNKINEILSKKDLVKNKKLDNTFKKFETLKSNIENEINNENVNETSTIKLDKQFNELFKTLMSKSNNDKHLKLFAIKHKLL